MYTSKTGEFIDYYWNELLPKVRTQTPSDDDKFILEHPTCKLAKCLVNDFDEKIAFELGKILVALYDR